MTGSRAALAAVAIAVAAASMPVSGRAAGLAPTPGPRQGGAPPNLIAGPTGEAAGDARWSALFVLHCSGCHGADGAGRAGAVPDLRDNLGRLVSIPEGRRFVLQVPGVSQARLPDDEVAALANWMLRRFSASTTPAGFRRYDAAEVREARRSVPGDVAGARRAVVAALRERGVDAR